MCIPSEPKITLISLSQGLKSLRDAQAQMKGTSEQNANAAQTNQIGVEWSQAIVKVNNRHNLTVDRLTHLEKQGRQKDLPSRASSTVLETLEALR